MIVLVTGGRNYADREKLFATLDALYRQAMKHGRELTIVHGGATGADSLASEWCKLHVIPEMIFRADWQIHGRAAGPMRNAKMLVDAKPVLVVAFPGGRGTFDMVSRARKAGVRVMEVS
jgi:hypothetical protein